MVLLQNRGAYSEEQAQEFTKYSSISPPVPTLLFNKGRNPHTAAFISVRSKPRSFLQECCGSLEMHNSYSMWLQLTKRFKGHLVVVRDSNKRQCRITFLYEDTLKKQNQNPPQQKHISKALKF